MPKLFMAQGKPVYSRKGKKGAVFACVMEFVDWPTFEGKLPAKKDIGALVKILAKIHKIRLKIRGNYDNWGPANLLQEYGRKKKWLAKKDHELIRPIIEEFMKLDFRKFRKGIIHGDLQDVHVKKGPKGKYCIIDFGTVDYNFIVFDIAIFIALFCTNPESREKLEETTDFVLKEYEKHNRLSNYEISSIPSLIRAVYAINCIAPSYLHYAKHDNSRQTVEWLKFARKGIRLYFK